jgi:hypothetical protein
MNALDRAKAKIAKMDRCPTEAELRDVFTEGEIKALGREGVREMIREALDEMSQPSDPVLYNAALEILEPHMRADPTLTVRDVLQRVSESERKIVLAGLPRVLKVPVGDGGHA